MYISCCLFPMKCETGVGLFKKRWYSLFRIEFACNVCPLHTAFYKQFKHNSQVSNLFVDGTLNFMYQNVAKHVN